MAVTIRNKLNQPLLINRKGKGTIHVPAFGKATISNDERKESPQIENMIASGYIRIVDETVKSKPEIGKPESAEKKQKSGN